MSSHAVTKRAKRKLRSNRGDSLAEVLIALLIAAIALVMLASMINASANMIGRSKVFMNTYYTDSNDLNAKTSEATSVAKGTPGMRISLTVPPAATPITEDYAVDYEMKEYQNKKILSFWIHRGS